MLDLCSCLLQGHEDEVAQVGGSLASYFEVYHRLLATRLAAATRATTTQQLSQIAAETAESCVDSQHTYVHAQQLLTSAACWLGGAVFRRLSQEVEAKATAHHGGAKVYQLQVCRRLTDPYTALIPPSVIPVSACPTIASGMGSHVWSIAGVSLLHLAGLSCVDVITVFKALLCFWHFCRPPRQLGCCCAGAPYCCSRCSCRSLPLLTTGKRCIWCPTYS